MNKILSTKNNKGVALVSVLICIAFISIIASSLLMISFNNFQMKTVQNRTRSNFYETEQDFNYVAAKVRSTIIDCESVKDIIEDPAFLGATSSDGVNYTYNPSKLSALAYKSGNVSSELGLYKSDATKADEFTISSDGVIVFNSSANLDKVTIKGVTVKQKSFDGYENEIKSDIVVYAEKPNAVNVSSGVGDFSLIMDNSIGVTSTGDPISLNIMGNGFFCKPDSKYDPITPSGSTEVADNSNYALVVSKNCRVGVLGDYCVSYGSIKICDGGLLTISGGNLTVYGDIIIEGNGALLCAGKIYMDKDNGYTIKKNGTNSYVYPNDIDPTSVSTEKFKQFLSTPATGKAKTDISLGSSANIEEFGLLSLITKPANPIVADSSTASGYKYDKSLGVTWDGKFYETVYSGDELVSKTLKTGKHLLVNQSPVSTGNINVDGQPYRTYFEKQGTTTLNNEFRNCLAFNWNDADQAVITESQSCATIISKAPVACSQKHGITMTKIGNDAFHKLTAPFDPTKQMSKQKVGYSTSVNMVSIKDNGTGSGTTYRFNVGDFFADDADDIMNAMCSEATGGGSESSSKPSQVAVNFVNWEKR